jgi:hypothetical protein
VQETPPTVSDTTTTEDRLARCRGKRGPSKLPTLPNGAKHVIIELDAAREPIEPLTILGSYKTSIGVLVKDHVPIKYRHWHRKNSDWAVPSSLMELCWQKLKELFEFPPGFNEEVTKDRAFYVMGNSFKYFRFMLHKYYVKKGIEPD